MHKKKLFFYQKLFWHLKLFSLRRMSSSKHFLSKTVFVTTTKKCLTKTHFLPTIIFKTKTISQKKNLVNNFFHNFFLLSSLFHTQTFSTKIFFSLKTFFNQKKKKRKNLTKFFSPKLFHNNKFVSAKNSNCDRTQKVKLWQFKNSIGTKLKLPQNCF